MINIFQAFFSVFLLWISDGSGGRALGAVLAALGRNLLGLRRRRCRSKFWPGNQRWEVNEVKGRWIFEESTDIYGYLRCKYCVEFVYTLWFFWCYLFVCQLVRNALLWCRSSFAEDEARETHVKLRNLLEEMNALKPISTSLFFELRAPWIHINILFFSFICCIL